MLRLGPHNGERDANRRRGPAAHHRHTCRRPLVTSPLLPLTGEVPVSRASHADIKHNLSDIDTSLPPPQSPTSQPYHASRRCATSSPTGAVVAITPPVTNAPHHCMLAPITHGEQLLGSSHTACCPVCLHEHYQRSRLVQHLTHSGTACLCYLITHHPPLTTGQISANMRRDKQHHPTLPERHPSHIAPLDFTDPFRRHLLSTHAPARRAPSSTMTSTAIKTKHHHATNIQPYAVTAQPRPFFSAGQFGLRVPNNRAGGSYPLTCSPHQP